MSIGVKAKMQSLYSFEPNKKYPYGRVNPEASKQVKDFEEIIGQHTCESISRNTDQSWREPVDMIWTFKYIMNGTAVQDSTLKADGKHSGSIRIYDVENKTWQISYYSSQVNPKAKNLPMWTGGKKSEKLVFYRNQKAPNGTDGFFRLSFYDIDKKGFKWVAEWTDKTETTIYPTWKIECKKVSK